MSERCAKQQGRPAREVEADLMGNFEGRWCDRCATEDKRVKLMEGHRD